MIGIDLVSSERIASLWKRHGDRFTRRILSNQEQTDFEDAVDSVVFLTRAWGVKEAVYKAISQPGIGFYPAKITAQCRQGRWRIFLDSPYCPLTKDIYIQIEDNGEMYCVLVSMAGPVTAKTFRQRYPAAG